MDYGYTKQFFYFLSEKSYWEDKILCFENIFYNKMIEYYTYDISNIFTHNVKYIRNIEKGQNIHKNCCTKMSIIEIYSSYKQLKFVLIEMMIMKWCRVLRRSNFWIESYVLVINIELYSKHCLLYFSYNI